MTNETFGLNQVTEKLGDLTRGQLGYRRRKLSDFLEPHELRDHHNRKVKIDQAGLEILKKAEEIYQNDEVPYKSKKRKSIPDLDEFQETVEKIEEEQGTEQLARQLQSERGKSTQREKSTQLSQQLQKKNRKLETLQRQKQTMEKVRDSIIERLAVTDSIEEEDLDVILSAIDVLEKARD